MNRASELPLAQPLRSTSSWIRYFKSEVRCGVAASFNRFQGGGCHAADCPPRGRAETLLAPVVKAGALSCACAWMRRSAEPLETSSARNWTWADLMVAPGRDGDVGEAKSDRLGAGAVDRQLQVGAGQ